MSYLISEGAEKPTTMPLQLQDMKEENVNGEDRTSKNIDR